MTIVDTRKRGNSGVSATLLRLVRAAVRMADALEEDAGSAEFIGRDEEWMAAADPRWHVCGWCMKAALAAGTEEADAYGQVERFDLDGVQGHTLSCKHNPLVQRINDLEAMRGRH